MKIKRLELVGFKSFVDPTVIDFEAPIIAVVGPNGSGKCVTGDTLVPLSNGKIVPIRSLIESAFDQADSIESMDDGEYTYDNPDDVQVLSLDPNTLRMTARPVLAFVRRKSPETLLKIRTRSGRMITATKYHPLFTWQEGRLRAIRADELKEDMNIAAPRHLPVNASQTHFVAIADQQPDGGSELVAVDNVLMTRPSPTLPLKMHARLTPDWGRFLGYIISEGQNSAWTHQVRFVNSDPDVVEDFCRVTERIFQRHPVVKEYKEGTKDCLLFSSILCNLLDQTFGIERGGHSSTKKIPSLIFSAPDEVAWAFLSALIEGDGYIHVETTGRKRATYLEYASASEALARGLATLLLRFGIRSVVRAKKKRATNGSGTFRTYYSVFVYGSQSLHRLASRVTLVGEKKQALQAALFTISKPNPNLDLLPQSVTAEFKTLWDRSGASIEKSHPMRGRYEVYREGGCQPSREGLQSGIRYARTHAQTWSGQEEVSAQRLERLATSDIYWDAISQIEEVAGEEWVYDLCVEETHNFVANDLIVHNSNVVDAIRWVMGEMSAKSLRGKGMEDVIFNGCEGRPAVGLAEVSLTFSTEDGIVPSEYAGYPEITITRRLYRSGESEYLINKVPGRLRDIIELFLGTGVGHRAYSVIEQGRIDYAINAKPEDRRLLIEEAAGISKFKARKEAALRKIEGADQNLARLKDILREVTRQIQSLDRQVKKAERYKTLKSELRDLEIRLSATTFLEQTREAGELKSLLEDWTRKDTEGAARLAALELDLQTKRLQQAERERELSELQERFFETSSRLQLAEAEGDFQKKERTRLEELIRKLQSETTDLEEKRGRLLKEREGLEARLAELMSETSELTLLEKTEQEWQESVRGRDAAVQALEELEKELTALSEQESHLSVEHRLADERHGALASQKAKSDAEWNEILCRETEARQSFDRASADDASGEETLRTHRDQATTLQKEIDSLKDRKEVAAQELRLRQEEMVLKRSRIKSLLELEKNFEGYDEGVRTLLKAQKEGHGSVAGILGVVADLVETPAEYETAVSAALGEKLQYVIVKSQEEGISAIGYLKTQAAGRGAFIPLALREKESEPFPYESDGIIGPLLSRVRLKEEYRPIIQYLLGDVILVRSLEDALSIWRANGHKKTLVTLEGEVIDPHGVMSGGTTGIRGKILLEKKRELKGVRADVGELEAQIGLEEDSLSLIEGEISERMLRLEEIDRQIREEELQQIGRQKERDHRAEELGQCQETRKRIEADRQRLEEQGVEIQGSLTTGERQRAETAERKGSVAERLAKAEAEAATRRAEEKALADRVTDLKIKTGSLVERRSNLIREIEQLGLQDQERARRLQEIAGEIEGTRNRRESIVTSLRSAAETRAKLAEASASLGREQEVLKKACEGLRGEVVQIEEDLKEVRKEVELARSHVGDLRITLSRLEADRSHLEAQILEKYSVTLSQIAPPHPKEGIDRPAEEARLADLKEKIEKLGDVNLGAIPEYEELKERERFLKDQVGDLEQSLEAIRKAIVRINQTTRKRFEETFHLVNERFQSLVPRLFRGGRSELRLVTEGDFQHGVELFVQPPGKKLSHVGLLSGGEKAMAALAFVFSIFLVKPSPFCILDEVDAPLDDTNVDRFHNLLTEMVPRSQFILITHNRRTMERADLLYGVTMQEAGVSRLVSVKLEALPLAS